MPRLFQTKPSKSNPSPVWRPGTWRVLCLAPQDLPPGLVPFHLAISCAFATEILRWSRHFNHKGPVEIVDFRKKVDLSTVFLWMFTRSGSRTGDLSQIPSPRVKGPNRATAPGLVFSFLPPGDAPYGCPVPWRCERKQRQQRKHGGFSEAKLVISQFIAFWWGIELSYIVVGYVSP